MAQDNSDELVEPSDNGVPGFRGVSEAFALSWQDLPVSPPTDVATYRNVPRQ